MYFHGNGVSQDPSEALNWFGKAAEHGSAAAENQIGFAYEHGQGVPQDYGMAEKWYRKAAEHGLSEARHNLAIITSFLRNLPHGSGTASIQSFAGNEKANAPGRSSQQQ